MHMYVGVQRPEDIWCPALSHSILFSLESLTEPGTMIATRKPQWFSSFSPLRCWDYRCAWSYISYFLWVLGPKLWCCTCPVSVPTHWAISSNAHEESKRGKMWSVTAGKASNAHEESKRGKMRSVTAGKAEQILSWCQAAARWCLHHWLFCFPLFFSHGTQFLRWYHPHSQRDIPFCDLFLEIPGSTLTNLDAS